ncbi:MAG TPA: TlpA disulfide reductase family protein [Micromonosporaceae bacterium]
MRARVLVAVVAVWGALAAVAGCTTGTDAVNQMNGSDNGFVSGMVTTKVYPPADRPAAPAVTGTLLDGTKFNLADDRGHVVVLNFWGSWCADCRVEANNVQSVHEATAAQGVEFVGVNIRDEMDPANAFEQAFHITYPSIFDPTGRVALQFRQVPPTAIPSTIVIDANGRIAAVHLGAFSSGSELTHMISAASS